MQLRRNDIKFHYTKAIADLTLQEFGAFVLGLQIWGDKYGGHSHTARQFYLLLARGPFHGQFMGTFLETGQEKEDKAC